MVARLQWPYYKSGGDFQPEQLTEPASWDCFENQYPSQYPQKHPQQTQEHQPQHRSPCQMRPCIPPPFHFTNFMLFQDKIGYDALGINYLNL
jgi:hypothetical protein